VPVPKDMYAACDALLKLSGEAVSAIESVAPVPATIASYTYPRVPTSSSAQRAQSVAEVHRRLSEAGGLPASSAGAKPQQRSRWAPLVMRLLAGVGDVHRVHSTFMTAARASFEADRRGRTGASRRWKLDPRLVEAAVVSYARCGDLEAAVAVAKLAKGMGKLS
jgi:hypothetical protein